MIGGPAPIQSFPGDPDLSDFGLGDLSNPPPESETGRHARVRNEWGGTLRAIVADLSPGVGLRFRAWAVRNRELLETFSVPQQFAYYLDQATYRDALADEQRPEDERVYEWTELHMQGIRPLIEAEIRAQREDIANDVREAMMARLRVLADRGLVPPEVMESMQAAGGGSHG